MVPTPTRRLLFSLLMVCVAVVPLSAQRGGKKGGGGGDPTEILRPVLVGYPGTTASGGSFRYAEPLPAWIGSIDPNYDTFHPDQLDETGNSRALLRAVSARGDLTHGGGARFVLDVRAAADGSQALIATAETVGTAENPTWYYDGPGGDDDATDHVLLTDADYWVRRARWSRDGARVAFQGTQVLGGASGIFVADVVLDGTGAPDALANITLVAPGGQYPAWGGDRIAFARNADWRDGFLAGPGDGFVVDVTVATAPAEIVLGPVTSPPELSSNGDLALYGRDLGDRWDLFVRDLATGVESQLSDAGRVPETTAAYPAFSPDDLRVVFSINEACFSSAGCRSLAVLDVLGSGSRSVRTRPFTVKVGQGRSGRTVQVGSLANAIWRR